MNPSSGTLAGYPERSASKDMEDYKGEVGADNKTVAAARSEMSAANEEIPCKGTYSSAS